MFAGFEFGGFLFKGFSIDYVHIFMRFLDFYNRSGFILGILTQKLPPLICRCHRYDLQNAVVSVLDDIWLILTQLVVS